MEKQELSRLIGLCVLLGEEDSYMGRYLKYRTQFCYIFQVVKWASNSLQVPAMVIEMFDLGVLNEIQCLILKLMLYMTKKCHSLFKSLSGFKIFDKT